MAMALAPAMTDALAPAITDIFMNWFIDKPQSQTNFSSSIFCYVDNLFLRFLQFDHLGQGFLNYGSRPQMGSPKIILGSPNKLAFCALCRRCLKIPVVQQNFWKKLWLLHM